MIPIAPNILLNESEITYSFIRSPGPGGQNVNKVATAVELRFDVLHSSLPLDVKLRLMDAIGNKLTTHGELIIKATRHRTQKQNKEDALNRLIELLKRVVRPPKPRKKTKPTKASVEKRLTRKKLRSEKKSLRRKQSEE